MRAVFADTYYFLALLDRREQHHQAARAFDESLTGDGELVTTEMVLAEFLNAFAKYGAALRTLAATFVRKLREQPNTTIVPQTSRLFDDAFLEYVRYKDKECGLTDCASFVTMRAHGITDALTYDRHFEQVSFKALFRGNGF